MLFASGSLLASAFSAFKIPNGSAWPSITTKAPLFVSAISNAKSKSAAYCSIENSLWLASKLISTTNKVPSSSQDVDSAFILFSTDWATFD
ncbi:MAG TPA: hypothetical protein DEH15_01500 [Marinilabiliales bacterium]|nr:hypothetical protein [Marinilabiliales bacterium]HBY51127.1 hypothetical protein [Marinilabiliales bacterium]